MRILAAISIFLLSATLAALAQSSPPQDQALPAIHHALSTNPQAQAAFDRGLLDYYAYNPEAAEHEFYTAVDLNPHLAMAYWGIALSNAPNLNVPPTDDRNEQAREAIQTAKSLERYATAEDRALIDAASARFDDKSKASADVLLKNYRDALHQIAVSYPQDPDAAALYAESALYVAVGDPDDEKLTPAQRAERTARIAALLPLFQSDLAQFPNHVGVLHFYIHAAQFAGKSSAAAAAAKRLASFTLPPEDSHLTHMPGHIFFDLGMYQDALNVGERSVAMDLADFACCHPGYYSAPRYYHDHNVSFLLYALTQTGHLSEAVAVARREDNPIFIAWQLVANQQWQDVLALPYVKGDSASPPYTRGIAYVKVGDLSSAERMLADMPSAPADSPHVAAVRKAMRLTLQGEIALLTHDDATALQKLTDASAAAQTANRFGEEIPALYYYSPHMALARLAIRLGKLDVAKAALKAELTASPQSPSALDTLAQLGASH